MPLRQQCAFKLDEPTGQAAGINGIAEKPEASPVGSACDPFIPFSVNALQWLDLWGR